MQPAAPDNCLKRGLDNCAAADPDSVVMPTAFFEQTRTLPNAAAFPADSKLQASSFTRYCPLAYIVSHLVSPARCR